MSFTKSGRLLFEWCIGLEGLATYRPQQVGQKRRARARGKKNQSADPEVARLKSNLREQRIRNKRRAELGSEA